MADGGYESHSHEDARGPRKPVLVFWVLLIFPILWVYVFGWTEEARGERDNPSACWVSCPEGILWYQYWFQGLWALLCTDLALLILIVRHVHWGEKVPKSLIFAIIGTAAVSAFAFTLGGDLLDWGSL